MGISLAVLDTPNLWGGLSIGAYLRAFIDENGSVLRDMQDESGAVAVAYNIAYPGDGILASSAYPGAELYVTANAASDPNGNEANATTGWETTNVTLTSDGTVKETGNYSLKSLSLAAFSSARYDLDPLLSLGKRYRISFFARHTGTGGAIKINLAASSNGANHTLVTLSSADTAFQSIDLEFTYDATYRYLNITEASPTNDGGAYLDNISVIEANPLNADVTGATIAQPASSALGLAYLFEPGAYVDKLSAEENSLFSPSIMSVGIFGKVSGAGVWADNTLRVLWNLEVDGSNYYRGVKNTSNQLEVEYMVGGVSSKVTYAVTPTDWFHLYATALVGGNLTMYYNGVAVGTDTIANAIVGNLTVATIGAISTVPASEWDGWLCYDAESPIETSASDVKAMSEVGGTS